jgi:hypothetical protein
MDEEGLIGPADVHWYNNICYNWGDGSDYIANIKETNYKTATAFNSSSRTVANGNSTSDPQLSGIKNQRYWPASTASKVWQSGYNTGTNYNVYLLENSNFSKVPSSVYTREESKHNIGAYTLEGSNPEGPKPEGSNPEESNPKSSINLSTPSNLRIRK